MKIITKVDNNVTLSVQQTLKLRSVINQLIAEAYDYLSPENTVVIFIQDYVTTVYDEEDGAYHWYTVDNYGLGINEHDIDYTDDGEVEYCLPYPL